MSMNWRREMNLRTIDMISRTIRSISIDEVDYRLSFSRYRIKYAGLYLDECELSGTLPLTFQTEVVVGIPNVDKLLSYFISVNDTYHISILKMVDIEWNHSSLLDLINSLPSGQTVILDNNELILGQLYEHPLSLLTRLQTRSETVEERDTRSRHLSNSVLAISALGYANKKRIIRRVNESLRSPTATRTLSEEVGTSITSILGMMNKYNPATLPILVKPVCEINIKQVKNWIHGSVDNQLSVLLQRPDRLRCEELTPTVLLSLIQLCLKSYNHQVMSRLLERMGQCNALPISDNYLYLLECIDKDIMDINSIVQCINKLDLWQVRIILTRLRILGRIDVLGVLEMTEQKLTILVMNLLRTTINTNCLRYVHIPELTNLIISDFNGIDWEQYASRDNWSILQHHNPLPPDRLVRLLVNIGELNYDNVTEDVISAIRGDNEPYINYLCQLGPHIDNIELTNTSRLRVIITRLHNMRRVKIPPHLSASVAAHIINSFIDNETGINILIHYINSGWSESMEVVCRLFQHIPEMNSRLRGYSSTDKNSSTGRYSSADKNSSTGNYSSVEMQESPVPSPLQLMRIEEQ